MSAVTLILFIIRLYCNCTGVAVERRGGRWKWKVQCAAAARWYIVLCVGLSRRAAPRSLTFASTAFTRFRYSARLSTSPPLLVPSSPLRPVCVIDCPPRRAPLLHIHLLLLPLTHYCTNKLHITQQPDLPYSGFCSGKGYSSQIIWK